MNGIVLGNRYELLEKVGEGGMSLVFKARCNKLNRFVAVKILKKEFCNNADIVEKFKGEATAIAALSDNNIVNILDVGTQGDMNYIVMEYVDGKTLKDVIKQVGKMNYETAVSVAIQIAKALDCAHRNKIIHRDVKPQNILVTSDGIMKVTDFGIAKSATSSTITNTSTIMGSAHYLSPEQAKGSFIDCRTDIYSLGIVLYEMVTGTLPFEADTAVTIALKHLQEEVVPPKNLNSKIPESLNKLILKAMQKDPNKRYQSAKEMIKDLQKIKDDPNAVIDGIDDDNQNTIIMPAVTQEIQKIKDDSKNSSYTNDYEDDYEDDEYEEDDDYDNKPSKLKGKLPKILAGVGGVLIAIILIFSAVKLFGTMGSKEVEVPNLVGINVDDAKKKLEDLNLVLVEAGREQSDEDEGTIIESNPASGMKVKEKTEIRVIVSSGADKVTMPGLEEYDLATAKKILESLGIKNIETDEEYSNSISKGKVMRQDPEEDTEVSENDTVTLVISKGSKPSEVKYTTVPSVIGMSSGEAENKISNQGLNVSIQTKATSDESQNGVVISQSIGGGASAKQGATITITVGEYTRNEQPSKTENNDTNTENNNSGNSNSNNNANINHNNNSGSANNNSNNNNNSNGTVTPGGAQENRPAGPWDDEVPATGNESPESEGESEN